MYSVQNDSIGGGIKATLEAKWPDPVRSEVCKIHWKCVCFEKNRLLGAALQRNFHFLFARLLSFINVLFLFAVPDQIFHDCFIEFGKTIIELCFCGFIIKNNWQMLNQFQFF